MTDMKDRIILTCTECGHRHDLQVPVDATVWQCPNCETVQDVPRYTLPEAARVLRRMQCDIEGHNIEAVVITSGYGIVTHMIRCPRCDATFTEDTE